jgi:hypothetical protein
VARSLELERDRLKVQNMNLRIAIDRAVVQCVQVRDNRLDPDAPAIWVWRVGDQEGHSNCRAHALSAARAALMFVPVGAPEA